MAFEKIQIPELKTERPEQNIEELKENAEKAIRRLEKMKHPLSEKGEEFLSRSKEILDNPKLSPADYQEILKNVPTVENPHLEYFKDLFQGIPEEKKDEILFDLSVIQTTKGCSRRCLHCAVSADSKIKIMDYVTILKLIEDHQKYAELNKKLPIGNYFDNDPFDYRDMNIRDKDGNPADYGDVFINFAEAGINVGVITAGWMKSDKIAQRAGEKIGRHLSEKKLTDKAFKGRQRVILSLHLFSKRAREDREGYVDSIVNVIKTIGVNNIVIRYFGKTKELLNEVIKRVESPEEEKKKILVQKQRISISLGRAKEHKRQISEEYETIEKIERGRAYYQILPNGEIIYHEIGALIGDTKNTGLNIYSEKKELV